MMRASSLAATAAAFAVAFATGCAAVRTSRLAAGEPGWPGEPASSVECAILPPDCGGGTAEAQGCSPHPPVPCVVVPPCSLAQPPARLHPGDFIVWDAAKPPPGRTPSGSGENTSVTICHNEAGFELTYVAVDADVVDNYTCASLRRRRVGAASVFASRAPRIGLGCC